MPRNDYDYRIYIFDQNHTISPRDEQDNDFLNAHIEYIQVCNKDELKEDVLSRRVLINWIDDYGIMLAPNKCRIHTFYLGIDKHYIIDKEYLIEELRLLSIGHIDTIDRIHSHMEEEHNEDFDSILSLLNHYGVLRIYAYYNLRLNMDHAKIRYIDITNENDMKDDLLYSMGYMNTYMILKEDIRIKNKTKGFKNFKVITEIQIEDLIDDILSDRYEVEDKTIIVFTINAKFNSYKNFKSVPVSNMVEMKHRFSKLRNEANDPFTFEGGYCYVIMSSEEIRLYETQETVSYFDKDKEEWVTEHKYNWLNVNTVKELGYTEMHNLVRKINEKWAD